MLSEPDATMRGHAIWNTFMRSETPETTRRQSKKTRKERSHRIIMFGAASLAIVGLVTGGAFAAQSSAATQERVAATTALAESTGFDRAQLGSYAGVAKAHTEQDASVALAAANKVIAANKHKVDASDLTEVASSLASFETMPLDKVVSLTAETKAETASVTLAAAEADRAAAAAAAAKVAAAQAAAAEVAKSLATSNTPEGAKATARAMAQSKYGWGSGEFSCLSQLWEKESGWNYQAYNPSGATGIPQSLPGSKMATAGSDWATNATTQIAWGLEYISASSYGTPCAAWSHSEANNWY